MVDSDNATAKKKLEGCEFHGESKLVKSIQAEIEQEEREMQAVAALSRRSNMGEGKARIGDI
jgi:hypothetical protein